MKISGVWRYVYRAIDQHGQVIDVPISTHRDAAAARRFFRRALSTLTATPAEVVTDAAAVYPGVLDELTPAAWHHVEEYANNPIQADHSQLKLAQTDAGPANRHHSTADHRRTRLFVRNLRRGHYELANDASPARRVAAAFTELAQAI